MSAHEETLTATTITCKNCETVFEGNFCPNCSQRSNTHRLTLKHFAHEVFHAMTHADKGMLFLIKKLFRWPGIVATEYVAGKRKKYFSPITFLLITLALQLTVSKKTHFYDHYMDSQQRLLERISKFDPKRNASENPSLKIIEEGREQLAKVEENSRTLTFILLPVLAALTWLFFRKSGFNYTENLILAIFIQGQSYVLFLIVCIVPFLLYPPLVVALLFVYVFITWLYSMIAYRQFFRQRKRMVLLKGSIVMILYYVITQQAATHLLKYL